MIRSYFYTILGIATVIPVGILLGLILGYWAIAVIIPMAFLLGMLGAFIDQLRGEDP